MMISSTLTCPNCGHANQSSTIDCTHCHINLNWAMANLPLWDGAAKGERSERYNVVPQPDGSVTLESVQQSAEAAVSAHSPATDQTAMLKEIRSWGVWSLLLGAIHLVASGFVSAPWGILLLIVGLASFAFRSASMFIVYGVIMTWAALTNLLSGLGGWLVFAVLQFYWAVRIFQQFKRFRQVESQLLQTEADELNPSGLTPKRSERLFPWIGSLLSCSSVVVIFFLFVAAFFVADNTTLLNLWAFAVDLTLSLGVLGFAVGLAALLSRYHPRILGYVGLVTGILIILVNLALIFFLRAA